MMKRHRVRARAEGKREVWLQLRKSDNEPIKRENLVTYDWEKETGDNATILCPPLLPSEIGQWWRIRKRGKEDLGGANLLQTSMAGRRIEWWAILTENGSAELFAMFHENCDGVDCPFLWSHSQIIFLQCKYCACLPVHCDYPYTWVMNRAPVISWMHQALGSSLLMPS